MDIRRRGQIKLGIGLTLSGLVSIDALVGQLDLSSANKTQFTFWYGWM